MYQVANVPVVMQENIPILRKVFRGICHSPSDNSGKTFCMQTECVNDKAKQGINNPQRACGCSYFTAVFLFLKFVVSEVTFECEA